MAWSSRQIASIVRIALFAMLMAVSAPTISTVLSAACGEATAAHCHAQPKAHHLAQKCGYCTVQADLPAAPPLPAAQALVLLLPQRAVPELRATAPASHHGQLAPPPRAPPFA
ncbi:DUF2946 domain-containing protein [Pseudoduganella sp. DS3]|uniref:DUF2946 domain-containing protein n=1 Tax=Pseudoduganella guangdongensis TaxID=2692179 RepID=A0A6N9HAP3_9BURK|nr:DUF2946 domain-containing protein [Pseudoduganella guangdongensis]